MTDTRKKILLVDDEADIREFLRTVLEDLEVDFIEAIDGEQAVERARDEMPDLVILDVEMPKKDGFHVFGELRRDEATRQIPIVMLTAVSERTGIDFGAEDMGEYLGSEPEAYHDKPIDPAKMVETVKGLLA